MYDIMHTYSMADPYLRTEGKEGIRPSEMPFSKRVPLIWAAGLSAVFGILAPYIVVCVLLLGVWGKAEDCRPMFGNPWECTSVRRFWGRGWHQLVRRVS
jgi:hypothetical protein